jgi:Fe-S-cluster-containing dehydrogenase component
MSKETNSNSGNSRRNFLKYGLLAGGAALTVGGFKIFSGDSDDEEKIKALTADGNVIEVPKSKSSSIHHAHISAHDRKGIPGKKFVMVIDLSRCKNAKKCQEACQKTHSLSEDDKWLKIYKMQDAPTTSPYWMPKTCFHCDKPPCVKVCPVGATYKRDDGIVAIDNERCVGCRFCMAACPYSSRTFNWSNPAHNGSGHTGCDNTRVKGTVDKCDFCPEMLVQGELPHCVTACPNGVFLFGDLYEDAVTNGSETFRFSELIRDKGGYRFMEALGTEPSVYYLPAVNRLFPFKDDDEQQS